MAEGVKAKESVDLKGTTAAVPPSSPEEGSGEDDIYEVEKIIDMCKKEGTVLYRVRWEGYGPEWDTWEPYNNLVSCKDMIQTFLNDRKKRKRKHSTEVPVAPTPPIVPVEEGSENEADKGDSGSDKGSRKKGTKGTYYYVNNSDDEADTLKDKFWRDLEQGKIDVFSDDLYSKVKSQGRASRPVSLAEKTQFLDSDSPQQKKKKVNDGRGRKRASEGGGEKEMKRCNSAESTSSSVSGVQAGSASSISENQNIRPEPRKVRKKRGRKKKLAEPAGDSLDCAAAMQLKATENYVVHTKEESSPASPEVERMDILSAPASPDEVDNDWNPEVKTEVIPEAPVKAEETVSEDYNVTLSQKDPKLKSSCVVVVENLGAKARRPVHPSTPSNINTSPLAAKSPLDICSPALPTTSTVSETWGYSSPKVTQDNSVPGKPVPTTDEPKLLRKDRSFMSAFSPEYTPNRRSVSPEKENIINTIDANELTKVESTSFQVTNYRAIFSKQESAQTRTDLKSEQAYGMGESPGAPSPPVPPKTVPSPQGSSPSQGSPLPPVDAMPFNTPAATMAPTLITTQESMLPSAPMSTSADVIPGLDSELPSALDSLAASLSMDDLTHDMIDSPSPGQQADLASGLGSVSSYKNSATPSPIMSSSQAIIPSPSASGEWSNSPGPSPSFESDFLDFDLEDLNFSLLDIKQLNLEHGNGGVELTNSDLRHAVRRNDYEKVRLALKCQGNLDLEQPDNYYGMTLIMLAAQFGYDDMLELLALQGVQVNAQQKNGATALMHACEQGHRCTVELLIALGAHVNVPQRNGETALMKAVRRCNKHIVQMLLDAGANFSALSNVDNSAVKQAKQLGNMEIIDLLNKHISRVMVDFNNQVNVTLNNTAQIVSPLFPIQCFALSEGSKFTVNFNHELTPTKPGLGMLLFIAHARMSSMEAKCRFYGPCTVNSAILNGVPLKSLTEEANFVLSFTPVYQGRNTLDIHTVQVPKTKTKLLVCAYKAQLIMPGD